MPKVCFFALQNGKITYPRAMKSEGSKRFYRSTKTKEHDDGQKVNSIYHWNITSYKLSVHCNANIPELPNSDPKA